VKKAVEKPFLPSPAQYYVKQAGDVKDNNEEKLADILQNLISIDQL
jgi:hypothetical protein